MRPRRDLRASACGRSGAESTLAAWQGVEVSGLGFRGRSCGVGRRERPAAGREGCARTFKIRVAGCGVSEGLQEFARLQGVKV
jgi:hypothetical protein